MKCFCGANCPITCVDYTRQFHKAKDESGMRYGKLTVVERVEGHCWLTNCECGGFRVVDARELRAGRAKACKTCAKETQGKGSARWEREAA